jgi:Flp pilus assembly pilin Flp
MYCLSTRITKSEQRGQAMTEYLVAMLVVMMMVGVSFAGENSVIDLFLNSVQTAFDNLSSFLSLPL